MLNAGSVIGRLYGYPLQALWGVGFLASSLSASAVANQAGQVITEGFFDLRLSLLTRALIIRGVTLGPGILISVLITSVAAGSNGSVVSAMNACNIVQTAVLPFVLLPLMRFAAVSVDGKKPPLLPSGAWRWLAMVVMPLTVVMSIAAIAVAVATNASPLVFAAGITFLALYTALLLHVARLSFFP